VAELTRQGHSADGIATKLGISKRHVVRIRSKTHTNVHPKAPLLTDEEVERATRMLDDGMSYTEVSRTLGRTFETIQRRIPGRGWTREQTGEYNSATRRLRKKMDL